ncbi:MAG TPA: TonB-dependent receptor, partial [Prolixibacteraceae bacterium]
MNFTVAFDSKAMSEFRVSGTFTGQNPEDIINQLIKNTGYKVEVKFGNYLIIPEFETKQTAVPAYRRVSGLIVDQVSGEHLPNAIVSLPFQKLYLTSSVNGTFTLRIPTAQSLRMNIQYLGYQSVDSTFSTTDSSAVLTLRMKPKSMELATIHIKKTRLKMIDQNKEAGQSTVNMVGFVNLPNMGENDIFRTIQLLPGIGYNENSSGLNIRGGTADQNLVLFDGFTLYNLDHFFGTFSSINPNIVKDIQIYKGGFDSRYGERLSGIIDITGKTGNKYDPKINAGLNLVSGNLSAELPISEKLTLVVAGRRSYADIYSSFLVNNMLENQVADQSSSVKNGTVVKLQPGYYFYDYNAKLTFSKSEQEKMSVSVFGGKDFLSSIGEGKNKQLYTKTTDKTNWGNYGFSFSWIKQWQEKFFSNLQIGYSGYQNNYANTTDVTTTKKNMQQSISLFETDEENKLNDFSASLRNQFSIDLKNSIDFGLQTKFNEFTYQKNAGTDAYYSDIANSSWLYTSYIQLNSQPVRNLSLKFGGRASFYSPANKLFFEPRISGNYRINDFISLKFATGRYYQFLNKVT